MNKLIDKVLFGAYSTIQKAIIRYKGHKYRLSPSIKMGEGVRIYYTTSIESCGAISVEIGNMSAIRGRLVTFPTGGHIKIGDFCYVGENTQIWSEDSISIGNNVLIAHNCNIMDSDTHPLDAEERHDQFVKIITSGFPKDEYESLRKKKIVIEDNAWICANVTLHKGIIIGNGAIVSAGSVVIEDVPSNTMVAGNPAKIVKYLKNNMYDEKRS